MLQNGDLEVSREACLIVVGSKDNSFENPDLPLCNTIRYGI